MSKSVIVVVVCTLLALIAATVWVPLRMVSDAPPRAKGEPRVRSPVWYGYVSYSGNRIGNQEQVLHAGPGRSLYDIRVRVHWPRVFATHALILLLGGGLLTLVVRRERRRKAAA